MSSGSSSDPRAANRLAQASSPYLRQHAHQPVAWQPWDEAAWARARAEGKPVFLSVGYSTCHWCHVMARESFDDPGIAEKLNRDFVSIKVDREERPDVDRLYMTYVQAATGQGGWPMSVWLTPEGKPFYGGTYFPPEDRWGRMGFGTLLDRLAELWRTERDAVVAEGERVLGALRAQAQAAAIGAGVEPGETDPVDRAFAWCEQAFDAEQGGFGGAPKFPRPAMLNLLLRLAARGAADPRAPRALQMAEVTLGAMARGGVRDHLGGGFHRYAVDAGWRVPHFEKMLYDQGQLACAYLELAQATGAPVYRWVAREILDYVRRDLGVPGGGLAAAEDADSAADYGPDGHAEGAFYVWTREEIAAAAGADAELVIRHYGVLPDGNAPVGSDPHGELAGRNVLHQAQPLARTAQELGLSLEEAEARLLAANTRLAAARARRPRPARDDKVIAAWNGLALSAFARSAQVSAGSPEADADLATARNIAGFLRRELRDPATGRLRRSWLGDPGTAPGFAEDYACVIQGLLDLYEAGGGGEWLQWAVELQGIFDADFWDEAGGGYFDSPAGDASLLLRLKEDYDGAEPAPASVAALNLFRLAAMLGDEAARGRAESTIAALRGQWSRAPHALPQLLVAREFGRSPVRQIVLAGNPEDPALRALQAVIHERAEAPRVILWADGGPAQEWLAARVPLLAALRPVEGRPTAYVCRDFACQCPTAEPEELRRQLA